MSSHHCTPCVTEQLHQAARAVSNWQKRCNQSRGATEWCRESARYLLPHSLTATSHSSPHSTQRTLTPTDSFRPGCRFVQRHSPASHCAEQGRCAVAYHCHSWYTEHQTLCGSASDCAERCSRLCSARTTRPLRTGTCTCNRSTASGRCQPSTS